MQRCVSQRGRQRERCVSECNDARAVVQRRSESAPAMPDPATRRRVCTVHSEAAVQLCGSGLWFRERFNRSLQLRLTRMLTSETAITVDGPQRAAAFGRGKAAQTKAGAAQNQGRRESGRHPFSVSGPAGSDKTRTNLGCLLAVPRRRTAESDYFPHGSLPRGTSETSDRESWSQKLVESPRALACKREIVEARDSSPVHIFERTTAALRALLQNSATRAQLGPPNWISASPRRARARKAQEPMRVRRARAVAAPAAPSTAKLPERSHDHPQHFAAGDPTAPQAVDTNKEDDGRRRLHLRRRRRRHLLCRV